MEVYSNFDSEFAPTGTAHHEGRITYWLVPIVWLQHEHNLKAQANEVMYEKILDINLPFWYINIFKNYCHHKNSINFADVNICTLLGEHVYKSVYGPTTDLVIYAPFLSYTSKMW